MSKVRQLKLRKLGNKMKPPGETSFHKIFLMYKANAKNKVSFNLTKKQFREIIIQNCVYCGEFPKKYNPYLKNDRTRIKSNNWVHQETIDRAWINVNGIDRVNNKKGYILSNCVPCCFDCNEMKNNRSLSEFLNHIIKIAKHTKRKNLA